jgi:hypothetical protein
MDAAAALGERREDLKGGQGAPRPPRTLRRSPQPRRIESQLAAAGSFERRILPAARRLQELGASSEAPPEVASIDTRARLIADAADGRADDGSGSELPFG